MFVIMYSRFVGGTHTISLPRMHSDWNRLIEVSREIADMSHAWDDLEEAIAELRAVAAEKQQQRQRELIKLQTALTDFLDHHRARFGSLLPAACLEWKAPAIDESAARVAGEALARLETALSDYANSEGQLVLLC